MLRRTLRLALLAAALLALIAPRAFADDAILRIDGVSASAGQVSITGTLNAAGAPVGRQEVVALIDGVEIGRNTTRGNGTFTISAALSAPLREGHHGVQVRFNGGDGHSPAASSADLSVAATGIGAGSVVAAKATTASAAPAGALRLSVSAPEDALNGEVIELSGTVVDASGAGAGGAVISVRDGSGEVPDSYAVTDGRGRFTTWYSIPSGHPDGELRLTLVATGAGSDKVTVSVPVTHTDIPEVEPPTTAPSATPSPTPPADAGSAGASLQPTPTAVATPEPVEERADGGPLFWVLAAVLAVVAIAVICFGLLMVRARRGRGHKGASELTFFRDEDESFLGLDDADEEPDSGPTAPRRGLPPA